MNALFLILNDVYLLEEIHEIMYQCGVGATTIDSRGMGKVLVEKEADISMFTSMRKLLEGDKPYNKLIISVIRDDDKLKKVIDTLQEKITNIYDKGIGFMFVVPVTHCYGYKLEEDKSRTQLST
jgi:nitrogen regulatory protein PII